MNNLNYCSIFIIVFFTMLINPVTSISNWKTDESGSGGKGQFLQKSNSDTKSDSLPEGVTQDWLNNLKDENGQKLINNEDPEGDAMQERFITGYAVNDQLGYSVSSAGDVNGDGYCDVIVGAPFNDAGGSDAGRAYIFFGGSIINTVVDVILTGAAAGDNFGKSVSNAGDVNGDGYSDVIVGAPLNDGSGPVAGKAYIYYGGSVMNNVADVIMTGVLASDFFGQSVSSAGDVNGDGYADVIVGAYFSTGAGRTYIYYGGNSMNNIADVIMTGEATDDYFGITVSSAGDVNGDGYGDIIVGASFNDAGGSNTGRAYIYFGGNTPDTIADVIMTGEAALDFFGNSVSSAGDVNGDGYGDVIIGANGNDGGGSNAGRAYVYFGGIVMNNIADVIMTGAAAINSLGRSVSTAGDVNGDGFSDVIIGADLNGSVGFNAGRAYVYFGGSTMNNVADAIMTGAAAGNQFGYSVSSAGDMNGDGYGDVIAGAIGNDAGGNLAGRAYIYLNSMTGADIADEFFTGAAAVDEFGYSVSSAGDINGDGFNDIIIGAPSNDAGGLNAGRAYIYFGGSILNNVADVIMTGKAVGDEFGSSVSSAGDVNGDGFGDLIVGANYNDAGGSNAGRAYIYFGGNLPDTIADVIMTGATAGDQFGISVSTAGDVNGDGYSDVIVGVPFNDAVGSNAGRAYIYFGGNPMNNVADVTMSGALADDKFGISVSSAGDVNGDGFSDVIVGAFSNDAGGIDAGRAYIYFGGSVINNVADVIMTGEAESDFFGNSVSSAGDVNGDGFSDVIVGAPLNDVGGSNAGRAYIYFGGNAMNNVAVVIMTGEETYGQFGNSVSSAGDVNGDGFSDVIVGAHYNDVGGVDAGRAYIYFGGSVMNNVVDVIMTGAAAVDLFGQSVSSAGDINGDGFSDVIVGADYNDAGATNAGRAYLYLSSAPSVKPIFNILKDVPNDQGGQIYLKWARSGYDVQGINTVTSYSVMRSFPPVNGIFAWQTVAEINAEQIPFYSYIDHTPIDSTTNNSGTFFYRIKAKTSNIAEYWYSGILSGRSIDNIPPLMVAPFNAVSESNNIRLKWNKNTEPDLFNYILYRSVNPAIDPETATPLATVTDSTYLDSAPLSGAYYYFIVAQDVHNNKGPLAVTQSPNITLNMTMFIEGFYNSGSDTQVRDTIKVYLRNAISPFAKVDSVKGVVSANGSISLLFGNAPSGQYYIVTTHRNSIETWSKYGGESFTRGAAVNYNFTNASSQAFGNNLKNIDSAPARYGIYSGDQNQNGIVDLTDIVNVSNAASSFTVGYVSSDMNGDNITDLTDLVLTSNNASAFVSAVTP